MAPDTAIFDVDGTLADTNHHHALAWFRAFRAYDLTVPVWLPSSSDTGSLRGHPSSSGTTGETRCGS